MTQHSSLADLLPADLFAIPAPPSLEQSLLASWLSDDFLNGTSALMPFSTQRTRAYRPLPPDPTGWLIDTFPSYFQNSQGVPIPLAPHHEAFWRWVWALRAGEPASTFIALWARGGGKSVSAEMACTGVGYYGLRRYGLYISNTQSQADDHVATVGSLFGHIGVDRAVNKYGQSKGWRVNRLRTTDGFTLDAIGLDAAMRGSRLDESRPDFIVCHQRGTEIFTNRQWLKVEDHPTASQHTAQGLSLRIAGLPYAECVTLEHRYWGRKASFRRYPAPSRKFWWSLSKTLPQWLEAQSLSTHDYIGYPIDATVQGFEPLLHYSPGGGCRNSQGQFTQTDNHFSLKIPPEFFDLEWWWFFGYWWGDGHTVGRHVVGVTINQVHHDIIQKIQGLLERWTITHWTIQKPGCIQICFSHTVFAQWLKGWRSGNSKKQPPLWVEYLDTGYQEQIIKGYVAADGYVDMRSPSVRITSIHLDGLLSVRRMLMRLGIASTIRHGKESHLTQFSGKWHVAAKKYDLRFRQGAWKLGYPIADQSRYAYDSLPVFIEDNVLWSKIRTITPVESSIFIPIKTETGSYLTHAGLSHNCDDLDDEQDTAATIQKKILTLTRKILPAGAPSMAALGVQNIPNKDGIFAQLSDGRAPFLLDRHVSGPHPALADLPEQDWWQRELRPDGTPWLRILAGEPTWQGQGIAECEALLNKIGIPAFLVECQHRIDRMEGTMFKRHWFPIVQDWPRDGRAVRYWDFASTEAKPGTDPDWTVGLKLVEKGGQFWVADVRRERLSPKGVEDLVLQTALLDGRGVDIWLEQEGGSSGKLVTGDFQRRVLKGFTVYADHPTGPKDARAKPVSSAAEANNVLLVEAPWNEAFLEEVALFPGGAHDDIVDSLSGSHAALSKRQTPGFSRL